MIKSTVYEPYLNTNIYDFRIMNSDQCPQPVGRPKVRGML
jgi:hypothetical protein